MHSEAFPLRYILVLADPIKKVKAVEIVYHHLIGNPLKIRVDGELWGQDHVPHEGSKGSFTWQIFL